MKIGFIGLGLMGRGMVANLQKAGFDLVVHDLSRDAGTPFVAKGALWADTPQAVAEASDVVFTSLPTPSDVDAVCNGPTGLAVGFREGAAWFDLSTNSVELVRAHHAQLAGHGVDFLDAPVSGGPGGAASGKLALLVGGDRTVYDRYEQALKAMGDQARYVGDIGAGSIAKLVHNCASAAASVITEAFTLGVKAGVEPLALWEAIRQGAFGRNRSFEMFGTRFLPGKFDPPNFQLRLLHKDVQLALQLSRDYSVPMRMCSLAALELTEAMNRGWGTLDSQAYLLLQQERAGISRIEVPIEKIREVQERG